MLGHAVGLVLYSLTLVTTLSLVAALPVVFISMMLHRRRTYLWIVLLLPAAYLAFGTLGWSLRPSAWTMSFWETLAASVNAEKYGHALESQAERVAFYFFTPGTLGCLAAGLGAAIALRLRRRAGGSRAGLL